MAEGTPLSAKLFIREPAMVEPFSGPKAVVLSGELAVGLEPTTSGLQNRGSAN